MHCLQRRRLSSADSKCSDVHHSVTLQLYISVSMGFDGEGRQASREAGRACLLHSGCSMGEQGRDQSKDLKQQALKPHGIVACSHMEHQPLKPGGLAAHRIIHRQKVFAL